MSARQAGDSSLPIAIVTPWYGPEQRGGAETAARQLALRLAQRGLSVEVLTTCSAAFASDWSANTLPSGTTSDGMVRVRRFPVDRRDAAAFDAANGRLLGLPRSQFARGIILEDRDFLRHNIHSSALITYLGDGSRYAAVILTPYLYGVVQAAAAAVGPRGILQPCLHDESYAYLKDTWHLFQSRAALAFLSHGEAELAEHIYGPSIIARSVMVGTGIEPEELQDDGVAVSGLPERPFLLYLGRRDATKGVELLCESWRRLRRQGLGAAASLVLAGPGLRSYGDPAVGIVDLELVTPAAKAALLRRCCAFVHASRNESFSRSLMEAWHCGRPAVVHRDCPATAGAMRRAEAGWLAGEDPAEWADAMADALAQPPEALAALGRRGIAYANEHADWERCLDRYITLISSVIEVASPLPGTIGPPIDQVLVGFDVGDAISEEAQAIQRWLLGRGHDTRIIAQYNHEDLRSTCVQWVPGTITADRALIYHHSMGAEICAEAIAHPGPKALIYHNITPPSFFAPYKPELAQLLQQGLDDLPRVAGSFAALWADSQFNAQELAAHAGRMPDVLPLPVPVDKWSVLPDQGLLASLRSGGVRNLLFVGRIAPNKCQRDLVRLAWHLLRMGEDVRLCLIGQALPGDPYVAEVADFAHQLGISSRVWISNKLSVAELTAVWFAADVYVSLSEHEGFGVPLIEAMHFDVPVVAFDCTAIAETLAGCGLLLPIKGDLVQAAALVYMLLEDTEICQRLRVAQRRRRLDFLPAAVQPRFEALFSDVLSDRI